MKSYALAITGCLAFVAGASATRPLFETAKNVQSQQEPSLTAETPATEMEQPRGHWHLFEALEWLSSHDAPADAPSATQAPVERAPAAPVDAAAAAAVWEEAISDVQAICAEDLTSLCTDARAGPPAVRGAAPPAGVPPLGLGSFENDQCLRAAAVSAPCGAAIARADAAAAALPLSALLPPDNLGMMVGGAHHKCVSAVVFLLAMLGFFTLVTFAVRGCLMGCNAAKLSELRGKRRAVQRILSAIRANPELQKTVEDAAGVAVPPPGPSQTEPAGRRKRCCKVGRAPRARRRTRLLLVCG